MLLKHSGCNMTLFSHNSVGSSLAWAQLGSSPAGLQWSLMRLPPAENSAWPRQSWWPYSLYCDFVIDYMFSRYQSSHPPSMARFKRQQEVGHVSVCKHFPSLSLHYIFKLLNGKIMSCDGAHGQCPAHRSRGTYTIQHPHCYNSLGSPSIKMSCRNQYKCFYYISGTQDNPFLFYRK